MAIAILPAPVARIASPPARVPLLIDLRVTVFRLVTALASAELTIRHDLRRDALVVSIVRPQEGPHT